MRQDQIHKSLRNLTVQFIVDELTEVGTYSSPLCVSSCRILPSELLNTRALDRITFFSPCSKDKLEQLGFKRTIQRAEEIWEKRYFTHTGWDNGFCAKVFVRQMEPAESEPDCDLPILSLPRDIRQLVGDFAADSGNKLQLFMKQAEEIFKDTYVRKIRAELMCDREWYCWKREEGWTKYILAEGEYNARGIKIGSATDW